MNIKKISTFLDILQKNRKKYFSTFLVIKNHPILNIPHQRRYKFIRNFSTGDKKRREGNEIGEVDKKIQLTKFKVTNTFCHYMSSDDSDEEKGTFEEKGENYTKYTPSKWSDINKTVNGNFSHFDELQYGKHIHVEKNENKNIGRNYTSHSDESADTHAYTDRMEKITDPIVSTTRANNPSVDKVGKLHEQNNTSSCRKNEPPIHSINFSPMANKDNTYGENKMGDYEETETFLKSCMKMGEEAYYARESNRTNALEEELKKLEILLRPSQKDINNVKTFLNFLQNEINKHYKNCHVTPFGSIINGFWMRNSDIDICVQIPILLSRKDQISFLKKVCLMLNNFNDGIIEQRFSAKVPIIHFYCDNPKNSFQLSCDISVNNILAVINSKLIQKYVSIDKRLQIMGIALKYWSKNRNINDRSKGFLSSFSLILMTIHFLQYVIEPKILPSLQDISLKRNEKPFYVMGVDCKYCQDETVIREELNRINNYKDKHVQISTLLIEFFKFYGYKYKSGIIAIRDINDYYQNFKALKNYESYFLFVDNPFEVGKNVANILPQNYKIIINEMQRAYKILKNNGSWKDVCNIGNNSIHV
ncbi:conserved Plasmodium protein, unknown function [Plasmodium ovale]|nr:conserved Plasmodium protein, unknown function [Plasmodium ovale]